jgi:hypothetical protein
MASATPHQLLSEMEAPHALRAGELRGDTHYAAWLQVADAVIEACMSLVISCTAIAFVPYA